MWLLSLTAGYTALLWVSSWSGRCCSSVPVAGSGSDLVIQGFLLFSVLALSLALDLVLVVAPILVPDLVLEPILVRSASGLCLALVPSWTLVLSFLVSVPTLSWTLAWLLWCRYRPALTFWI